MNKIEMKYEATRKIEKLQRKVAWSLPKWLVMWAYVRVVAHATTGRWSSQVVPELSATEALDRWSDPLAPVPIHYNLIDAHNYIKYAKRLEQKQTYERVIESSRLPKIIRHDGFTYNLNYRDIDDNVVLSYVATKAPQNSEKRVLMHYEESTLRDCVTKAWRKIAEQNINLK